MRSVFQMMQRNGGKAAGALGFVGAAAGVGYAGYNSVFSVNPGERAVMFNRLVGVRDDVYTEGTHFKLPWFDMPTIMDIRTRPTVISSLTGSKDMQMITLSLRVLTRPDPHQLPFIFRNIGEDYDAKVLPSIVNEVLKGVIAMYKAENLLTSREIVSLTIKRNLKERAAEFHIILEDVSITDLQFGREFTAAVEAKQVAQQEAERARYIVEKAKQDKRSIIIKAQGEAKSAEMIGKAIADNPGFVELRRLDAARDIARTVSRSANKMYLPADSLLLNLMTNVAQPSDSLHAKK